jgi:F420-dependent oxidoreductase-like protein
MHLGVTIGYSGAQFAIDMDLVHEAERLGYASAWTAEAYGSDAVTPAAWILAHTTKLKVGTAIMQMPARTPAMTAMTAMSLDALSGGRFMLGLGPSGPQVVEGWYGVPYGRPQTRIREYIEIVRKILAREAPLVHEGFHYTIPYRGEGASGLGKPLKSILHGNASLKIFTGAISPAGVCTAAEVADGFFPLWMNPERFDLFEDALNEGFAASAGGKSLETFEIAPFVHIRIGDDLEACRRPVKEQFALYVGGMGARGKNFYTDYVKRLGYAEAAEAIQDAFLDGRRDEAVAAVPDALVDDVALVGPPPRIAERLGVWKDAAAQGQVDTLLLGGADAKALRLVAEEVL